MRKHERPVRAGDPVTDVRRSLLRASAVATAVIAACSFRGPAVRDSPVDASRETPDSGPCVSVSSMCLADQTTLRTCNAIGGSATEKACSWGCIAGSPARCGKVVPAGGAIAESDLDPAALTGLGNVVLGAVTVNADDGSITGNPPGFTYDLKSGSVAVFAFKSLTIASGGVTLRGSHPIVFVADGGVSIDGIVDARGLCANGGGQTAGPGGFDGGAKKASAAGSGGGAGTSTNQAGGGGGGYGSNGGSGSLGQAGGPAFGDPTITALVGGGGGGGGGGGAGGGGGGGGGAIQIVSNAQIAVGSAGGMNAGGCGGLLGNNAVGNDGGGGGGAGGTILLEAPMIEIAGIVAVNGGGGAEGTDGSAGGLGSSAAAGGGNGGAGGAGSNLGGASVSGHTNSGGGGAVGRIRINTRHGSAVVPSGAVISPDFASVPTTATQGTATIQ